MKAIAKEFAAVQFARTATHVSGIGSTPKGAVKDAKKYCDVSAGLRIVPMTEEAKQAVQTYGGTRNKRVALVLITKSELRQLALLRQAMAA